MATNDAASEYDGIRVAFEEGDYDTVISLVRTLPASTYR